MWLFTNFGFLGIVQKRGDTDLTVRSRVRGDLEQLRSRYLSTLGQIMAATALVFVLMLVGSGCRKSSRAVVDSWRDAGANLPDAATVRQFKDDVPHALDDLAYGIVHADAHVRMCSAYVISQLGPDAASLAGNLRQAYDREPVPINRTYLAQALALIGDASQNNVGFLKQRFASESDEQVRTYLAGAMLVLTGPEAEDEAREWINNSLTVDQLPSDPSSAAANTYWERRWGASFMLGQMGPRAARQAQALRRLADDPATPHWVKEQVHRDLVKIEGPRHALTASQPSSLAEPAPAPTTSTSPPTTRTR